VGTKIRPGDINLSRPPTSGVARGVAKGAINQGLTLEFYEDKKKIKNVNT